MILPLLALRRLDAVLEPTKQQVLAQAATFESIGPGQDLLLKRTAGFDFYNTSPLTLTSMLADDKHVAEQLSTYITGLSPRRGGRDGCVQLRRKPGTALPGGGAGRQHETPMDKLSALIATMNEKYGLELTEADRLLLEQQKAAVKQDDEMRLVALNNDREQYRSVLGRKLADLMVERHQANGELFDAFFNKPELQESFLLYLAETYEEFRAETPA